MHDQFCLPDKVVLHRILPLNEFISLVLDLRHLRLQFTILGFKCTGLRLFWRLLTNPSLRSLLDFHRDDVLHRFLHIILV